MYCCLGGSDRFVTIFGKLRSSLTECFGKVESVTHSSASTMGRLLWHNPFWDDKRKLFVIAVASAGLMFLVLFLGNLSHLYSSLFYSEEWTHSFKFLAVDFDLVLFLITSLK